MDNEMIPENQNVENKKSKNRGRWAKNFISMLAAGIVGSLITISIVPQLDFFQKIYDDDRKTDQTETEVTAKPVTNEVPNNTSSSVADMVEKASTAIVGIVNISQQTNPFSRTSESVEQGSGSGVIFKKADKDAYIVTNNHVIEGASKVEISLYDGEKTTAELIGADALTDLAVLKMDAKYADNVLSFGDSSSLRAGDQVLAIGNPLGNEFSRTVTQGIVSAVDRTIDVSTSAGEWEFNVIQTDAAINPGNSGGALINTAGQVIGINSLKISEEGVEGLGFAIPSNDVVPIVNEIIKAGKVERPYIGVSLANLEEIPQMYLEFLPEDVKEGAMITYVDTSSAAAKAGLRVQDVIVAVNDQEVKTSTDVRKYIYTEAKIGDQVALKIYREGKLKTVKLTLTSNY